MLYARIRTSNYQSLNKASISMVDLEEQASMMRWDIG
jgi:hypothetical protein